MPCQSKPTIDLMTVREEVAKHSGPLCSYSSPGNDSSEFWNESFYLSLRGMKSIVADHGLGQWRNKRLLHWFMLNTIGSSFSSHCLPSCNKPNKGHRKYFYPPVNLDMSVWCVCWLEWNRQWYKDHLASSSSGPNDRERPWRHTLSGYAGIEQGIRI